ncbi:hypothetical protein AX15_003798 [Amanita polypyramis BW_CC]|nr:hypothetical protein AX15_003798 [Amanita polypyramis BW_CC]
MEQDANSCTRVLNNVFGFSTYRGKQQEIVEAAVQGLDVFVIAPTGMGKSLCFQVPAIAAKCGVSIVVSPLLALIKNQIETLRSKAVAASTLSSDTSKEEKNDIIKDLSSDKPTTRLLYITPEKLFTNDFMNLIRHLYDRNMINRLIIDEAHCISEWGHDFRVEYRRLGSFRDRFADVPIMALTATATPLVQSDITRSLKMDERRLFQVVHPFNRENLFYEIKYISASGPVPQMEDICEYIWNLYRRRGRTSSGIVYCRTRATCDALSAFLRGKGLNARPYHRGLKSHALDKALREWMDEDGGVDIIVATIAFGLGIDKGDVRYVIHYDLPKSFEGYYQETGRAGRDGLPSKCILYYSREDALVVRQWVSGTHSRRLASAGNGPAPSQRSPDSLRALIQFAESTTTCRHVSICRYFGEIIDESNEDVLRKYCNKMCDVCKYSERTKLDHGKLSSEEFALSQLATKPNIYRQEEEDQPKSERKHTNENSRPSHAQNKGTLKRPNNANADRDRKKAKVEMAAPLVTKSFGSEANLKKPFKTPFLPLMASENVTEAPQPMEAAVIERELPEISDDGDEMVDVLEDGVEPYNTMDEFENPYTSSYEDLDEDVDLDASFSNKIPLPLRYKAYHQIKQSLSKTFASDDVCISMNCEFLKSDRSILVNVTKAVEFMAFSFSVTPQGYEKRFKQRINIIEAFTDRQTWDITDDDYELAQEILDIIEQYQI